MNLRDLQYVVAVADIKHFGKAADACFISQPTLSAQLKKLEEELGVLIFERNNKKVLITPIGDTIIQKARDILQNLKSLKEASQLAQDPYAGKIKIGIIPTLAPYLLPHLMPELKRLLPKLEIYLIEEKTPVLLELLSKGTLDAAFLATPVEAPQLDFKMMFSEPYYFLCNQEDPLSKKKSISLVDLIDQNLMLLAEGHCMREQVLEFCKIANTSPRSDFSATSLETLRLMIAAGNGATLIPALAAIKYQRATDIKILPFSDSNPSRHIALYWRQKSPRQACCEKMVDVTVDVVGRVLESPPSCPSPTRGKERFSSIGAKTGNIF